MKNNLSYYIPDFIPTISPVKQGRLINSHLSRDQKMTLERELYTRQLEISRLRQIKQNERGCIEKFHDYFRSKKDLKRKLSLGDNTTKMILPSIIRERNQISKSFRSQL